MFVFAFVFSSFLRTVSNKSRAVDCNFDDVLCTA